MNVYYYNMSRSSVIKDRIFFSMITDLRFYWSIMSIPITGMNVIDECDTSIGRRHDL